MTTQNTYRGSIAGSFVATGQSASLTLTRAFNVSLWGTCVATVQLERSFDQGVTWLVVSKDSGGTPASWGTSTTFNVSVVGDEPEMGVSYRLNCTSFTSGTVNYRLSQ